MPIIEKLWGIVLGLGAGLCVVIVFAYAVAAIKDGRKYGR